MKTEIDNDITEEVFDKNTNRFMLKCKVCDSLCDTYDVLKKHNESKKHINKRDSGKGLNALSFYCEICDKSCNTKDQLEIHNKGKQHMKKFQSNVKTLNKSESSSTTNIAPEDDYSIMNIFERSEKDNKPKVISDESSYNFNINKPISEKDENKCISELVSPLVNNLLTPIRTHSSITCQLCKKTMDTEEQYKCHCNGARHRKKLSTLKVPTEVSDNYKIDNEEYVHCSSCDISFHKNNEDSHNQGKLHKERLIKSNKNIENFEIAVKKNILSELVNLKKLKYKPRNYQIEICEKALANDSIVFLPTGTGKTLIGAMIILKMLEENPFHRTAFLVDKVLLVMQQVTFLKDQFEDIILTRFRCKDEKMDRTLKIIGLANEYVNTDHLCSVRDHDIIVATADLFKNCLEKQQLFWKDFSLVVLDEAHHCVKDHPYKRLLHEYHLYPQDILINDSKSTLTEINNEKPKVDEKKLERWKMQRCQIIGLTASPAGELDLDTTYKSLLTLLESLGDVEIVSVTKNIDELNEYTSFTNIETRVINYNSKEKGLREVVSQGLIFLLKRFERTVNSIGNRFSSSEIKDLTIEDILNLKLKLFSFQSEIKDIEQILLKRILRLLFIIETVDSVGYESAVQKFKKILDNSSDRVFYSNNIFHFDEHCERIVQAYSENESEKSTIVHALLTECCNVEDSNRTILVLVKERKVANKLEKILKEFLKNKYLVIKLIGHGTGNVKCRGMSIKKQKKALDFIREKKNQVIIATSVADEGIDLPECDLVIIINPPNSVQALIQIRGRARKKDSRLLMICRDQASIDNLEQLKLKESNIKESIEMVIKSKSRQD